MDRMEDASIVTPDERSSTVHQIGFSKLSKNQGLEPMEIRVISPTVTIRGFVWRVLGYRHTGVQCLSYTLYAWTTQNCRWSRSNPIRKPNDLSDLAKSLANRTGYDQASTY